MCNYEVQELVDFLMEISLVGKKSRLRIKFCKIAFQRLEELEEDKRRLIDDFCEKDENGKPKTVEEGNNKYIKLRDEESYKREYMELMNEEFIIEETNERKEMFDLIRDLILNTETEFNGNTALLHDRWCEIVES
ncbi:hypothetical protein B7C51_25240 (plasmid) [Paenibacillus larvae subsp. pulvifaciens]|uniref:Uncharacterized protein n=2 Tax=Paenibacillus larvae TaxID=1464 RepID=A0A1V0V0E1_9BACL|nr:hypothetical protein B7C51_25240 [Paenibacillus larvae subsp. pulvifaciens]